MATMGYSLPAAIGISVATGNRVIAFTGDGSLQQNIQEFQTLVEYNLPVKLFVLNNDGYHSIRTSQTNYFEERYIGESSKSGVSFPDTVKIAEAYGIKAFRINQPSEINDMVLKAPRNGRIQYRVVEPGEVVSAGGRVLSLVDLTNVYMTFFLPASRVGKLTMGGEALIVLDAAPDIAIPATISYVADVAQFTPKSVETQSEREKLMFRVKAQIPENLFLLLCF